MRNFFAPFLKLFFGISTLFGSATGHADSPEADLSFLEEAWKEREERVYKSFFPNMPQTIYTIQDPNAVPIGGELLVLSCAGVFEIPPTEEKKYWTYITSGLSNPLGDTPKEVSGFGCELVMSTPEQSPWAIHLLLNLMGYVLQTQKPFGQGHRIPLNSPIAADSNSALNTVLFWPSEVISPSFQLKSGKVQLLQVLGITQEEYLFAKNSSSEALYQKLKKLPSFPVIDLKRGSCVT